MKIIKNVIKLLLWFLKYRKFKEFSIESAIVKPLRIKGKENIYIGKSVLIQFNTWLEALPLTGEDDCRLEIGDGTTIGHFNHIYATKSIIIGKNVLTADKVYISDNLHSYEDINTPIKQQPVKQINGVVIGDGCWLGENVCVLGVEIGKQSVIGANSVVTKDIPPYSVAVGSPARIIKRYCLERKTWIKTDKEGNFLK